MAKTIEIKELVDWTGLTAFALVIGFLILLGITVANKDITMFTLVAGTLGPFIAAIVTFFFGIKKVLDAAKTLEVLIKELLLKK